MFEKPCKKCLVKVCCTAPCSELHAWNINNFNKIEWYNFIIAFIEFLITVCIDICTLKLETYLNYTFKVEKIFKKFYIKQ